MSGQQPGGPGMGMPGDMGGLNGSSADELGQLSQLAGHGTAKGGSQPSLPKPPPPPRPVGTLQEEVQMMGTDLAKGVVDIFNLAKWLGIEPTQLSPAELGKLKQVHANYSRLTEAEQAVVREKMQKEQQRKRMLEQEAAQKRQQDAAQSEAYVMPAGKQSGAQNPGGSKKQRAVQTLQDKRKQLSGPSSAN